MKLRLLFLFVALAGLSPLCLAEWEFFAMDTGTRDSVVYLVSHLLDRTIRLRSSIIGWSAV